MTQLRLKQADKEMARKAIKLSNKILKDMSSKHGCQATIAQKREAICLLPIEKARKGKCQNCKYWK